MSNVMRCLAVLFVIIVCTTLAAGTEQTVYGTGVSDTKAVPIQKLLQSPDKYVGQTIKIEGRITDVCPMRGCWIDIEGGKKKKQTIRFKVRDGEIEFPTEAKGKSVVAEGVFTKIEMSRDEAVAWARHLADERGESFDPATDPAPETVYRIQGQGAVIP